MSVASELTNYATYLGNAYESAELKGATIPTHKNMQNLSDAIDTIQIVLPTPTVTSVTLDSSTNIITIVGTNLDLADVKLFNRIDSEWQVYTTETHTKTSITLDINNSKDFGVFCKVLKVVGEDFESKPYWFYGDYTEGDTVASGKNAAVYIDKDNEIKRVYSERVQPLGVNKNVFPLSGVLEDGTPIDYVNVDIVGLEANSSTVNTLSQSFLNRCFKFVQPLGFGFLTTIPQRFMQNCRFFNEAIDVSGATSISNYFMYNCINFNQPIYADSLEQIGTYFLQDCTQYDNILDLRNVTSIGNYFLYNCTAFNKPLNLKPNVSLGTNFLDSCKTFNQPINLEFTTVPDAFMQLCYSFNQPIDLSEATTIGNDFLKNDSSFNQPLDLSSCTTIGSGFLRDCTLYYQPLTLEDLTINPDYFLFNSYLYDIEITVRNVTLTSASNNALSTDIDAAPMYTNGIIISGDSSATTLLSTLPNRTTSPYRNLVEGTIN